MPTINQYSPAQQVASADRFAIWQTSNGDTRSVSMNQIMEYVQANYVSTTTPDGATSIVSAPTSSGFSIVLPSTSSNFWVVLNPSADFALGTVVMPLVSNLVNGQQMVINSTKNVTTFTIAGNGASLGIVPTTISAGGFYTIKYNLELNTWYRVA